jgi:hypothetical protein
LELVVGFVTVFSHYYYFKSLLPLFSDSLCLEGSMLDLHHSFIMQPEELNLGFSVLVSGMLVLNFLKEVANSEYWA